MTIIDDIKTRVDLVELIREDPGVRLHKSGKNWAGFCPFHTNTHTPALIVFPDTQTWYCFGACNEGGTVIDWVLKKNRAWDVKEAVKELAKRASLPIGEWDNPELKQRLAERAREDALTIAARLFAKWLQEDQQALAYAHGRGWNDETITASRLGFSGRSTAAQVDEMRGEFDLHGIKADSPEAVMILGYRGDVGAWAKAHNLDPHGFKEKNIHGLMDTPGLVYAHRINGRIAYLSRRQLPGHDGYRRGGEWIEWKSFNPYAGLAGERVPFFNHMHLQDDLHLVIVEGQADAITLGQWGIPAMALAGSSWKNMSEVIATLKDKYDTIYFATDSDAPGRAVISGKDHDFPLAGYFGPMLWVANWPETKWTRPDGKEKTAKDANDLLQYYLDTQVDPVTQKNNVMVILSEAEPIVLKAAQWAGVQKGAMRQKSLDMVLPLIARMPGTSRNDYRQQLAKAIFPDSPKMMQDFNKLVGDQIKKGDDDEDGKPTEIIETLGGWYPTSEDGNKGYLVEMLYEPKRQKAKLAYRDPEGNVATAPWLDINGVRYIPQVDDVVKDETVIFPSDLGPLKSTRELSFIIELYLKRYFLLDKPIDYKLAAYYALFTWVYDCFDALAYFRARGPSGTGKSELAIRLGLVSYRLIISSGISSTASVKSFCHVYRGSLFLDECDKFAADQFDERNVLLNVGAMKRQAKVANMVEVFNTATQTRSFKPTSSNVYGPKMLTMYRSFRDEATENRCITIDLSKKTMMELEQAGINADEIPESMFTEAAEIRNMCLRWRLWRWEKRILAKPENNKKLKDYKVSPRINQVTRPIKVLAQDDDEMLKDIKLFMLASYSEQLERKAQTPAARVADAVWAAWHDDKYSQLVLEGHIGEFGVVKYIFYKHLAQIANEIFDEMNTTADIGPEDGKKKRRGIQSNTVGNIARDDLQFPTRRMGKGFVVILLPEKIEVMKVAWGLDLYERRQADTDAAAKQPEFAMNLDEPNEAL
jgi:DNA primase